MKITAVETLHPADLPNILWVLVHTDAGVTGLGETFRGAESVAAYVHAEAAPYLIGKDPLEIERHNRHLLQPRLGFAASGVEIRAASAIDIALWDLFGKSAGLPIHQLLGGLSRERIRVYNTCAGYTYNNRSARPQEVAAWSAPTGVEGPYDDQVAFVHRADELARSLIDEGYTAMKIWPFDPYAERSGGLFISGAELRQGLEPFAKIRRAVGDSIDVMCEFHSMWNLPTAVRIAQALEEFKPFWSEDPIKMDSVASLREYKLQTRIPVCASETLATRSSFRDILAAEAVDIAMLDLSWCGGISEARKIAAMAEAHQRPVAPHDCTGPVVLIASLHLALHAPNALFQEVVRAFLSTWYRDLVTELPRIDKGWAYPMAGSGLGTELTPDIRRRRDLTVRRTDAKP
jgi:L-alanine-DL-glutamate epimerase-like enolase superfamily enzyme